MDKRKIILDIEANNLLNNESLDYRTTPYKLKDTFKMHCVVLLDRKTKEIFAFDDQITNKGWVFDGRPYQCTIGEVTQRLENYKPLEYTHLHLDDLPEFFESVDSITGHNILDYDMLVLELWYGEDMYYEVEPDTLGGRPVQFVDTLMLSKTLNPDRFPGHSLEELSKGEKFKYELGFETYNPIMLYYCIRDVLANNRVLRDLGQEWNAWHKKGLPEINFTEALKLEKQVRYNVTRQSHYGFQFDKELAEWCVEDLDGKLRAIEEEVEPLLPNRPLNVGESKEFIPPKNQFKADGTLSSHMEKFLEKHRAEITKSREETIGKRVLKTLTIVQEVEMYGKKWELPLKVGAPIVKEAPMRLADQKEIKKYLIREHGWEPSTWADKAINLDKQKRTVDEEELRARVDRYVEDTLGSEYEAARCEHLECKPGTLKSKLMRDGAKRTLKVITQPKFTKNQDKDLCDNLVALGERVSWVQKVVEWLTYRHRRNAILSDKKDTGWLNNPRLDVDGRINTPADTLGAASSRMTHRDIANIPKASSLYGEHMRALFGAGTGVQIGADASSLEARIEAHCCLRKAYKDLERAKKKGNNVGLYEARLQEAKDYSVALLAEKPNSVHCVLARKLGISRDIAKNIRYACLPVEDTRVLTVEGWKNYQDLYVGQKVLSYNTETGFLEEDEVQAVHHYEDAELIRVGHKQHSFRCTPNHRWYGWRRTAPKKGPRGKSWGFFTMEDFTTEHNILCSAPWIGGQAEVTPDEAALVAWLLSDGHYKWSEKREITSASKGKKKGIICSISQADHKFQDEIEEVIKKVGIRYVVSVDHKRKQKAFRLQCGDAREFMDRVVGCRGQKHEVDWQKWLLTLPKESLDSFLYHFWLADGTTAGRDFKTSCQITQNSGEIGEAVALAIFLTGRRVTWNPKKDSRSCGVFRRLQNSHMTLQEVEVTPAPREDVFCITTRNGTFVADQGGFISITGNSAYGASVSKLRKMLGVSEERGTEIFDGFWEAAAPLKRLKESLEAYWETVGQKKFIPGVDGRALPVRSRHSLVNTLFQSTGVICMKQAIVSYHEKIKEKGWYKDPFREELSGEYVMKMIEYHKQHCGLA